MGYLPKEKITQKRIVADYDRIISVPYCNLQTMLTMENPRYYTCGTYGWNTDIYRIDLDTVIVTGYRPFGNYKPKYALTQKYESKAKEIYEEFRWVTDYEDVQNRLRNLIEEFVKEVCEK